MDFRHENNSENEWVDRYDYALSNLITEARIFGGLTQKKLAEKIGTTQSSIARAENGAVTPSHGLLKRIAEAIGTNLIPPHFGFMDLELKNSNSIETEHYLSSSFFQIASHPARFIVTGMGNISSETKDIENNA